ncbi:MAG TPA: PilZ domain-containing protein [Phenylobacterium sp.]
MDASQLKLNPRKVQELAPVEQRRIPRHEVRTAGFLVHGRSLDSAPCVLRNVSPLGARVRLKAPQFLSRPLYLVIVQTGSAFEAKIIWSRGGELGLSLQRRLDLETPKSEAEWAARRIWRRHMPRGAARSTEPSA